MNYVLDHADITAQHDLENADHDPSALTDLDHVKWESELYAICGKFGLSVKSATIQHKKLFRARISTSTSSTSTSTSSTNNNTGTGTSSRRSTSTNTSSTISTSTSTYTSSTITTSTPAPGGAPAQAKHHEPPSSPNTAETEHKTGRIRNLYPHVRRVCTLHARAISTTTAATVIIVILLHDSLPLVTKQRDCSMHPRPLGTQNLLDTAMPPSSTTARYIAQIP